MLCFICELQCNPTNASGVYIFQPQHLSNLNYMEIVQNLIGDDFLVIIDELDALCQTCLTLVEELYNLRMEVRTIEQILSRQIYRKFLFEFESHKKVWKLNTVDEEAAMFFDTGSNNEFSCQECLFSTKYFDTIVSHYKYHRIIEKNSEIPVFRSNESHKNKKMVEDHIVSKCELPVKIEPHILNTENEDYLEDDYENCQFLLEAHPTKLDLAKIPPTNSNSLEIPPSNLDLEKAKDSLIVELAIDKIQKPKEKNEINVHVAGNHTDLTENHSNLNKTHSDVTKSKEQNNEKICSTCGDNMVPGKRCSHVKGKKSGKPLERCDVIPCNRKFYGKDLLEKHKYAKHSVCRKCDKKFLTWGRLEYHLKTEHVEPEQCEMFPTKETVAEDNDKTPPGNDYCLPERLEPQNINLKDEHPNVNIEEEYLEVDYEDFQYSLEAAFPNNSDLLEILTKNSNSLKIPPSNLNRDNDITKVVECSINKNQKSKETSEINDHVAENSNPVLTKNHSAAVVKPREQCKKTFCTTCGDSKAPAKKCRHEKGKKSGIPLESCDINRCTRKFYGIDLLELHKQERHLICKECNEIFTTRGELDNHLKAEHVELLHCEIFIPTEYVAEDDTKSPSGKDVCLPERVKPQNIKIEDEYPNGTIEEYLEVNYEDYHHLLEAFPNNSDLLEIPLKSLKVLERPPNNSNILKRPSNNSGILEIRPSKKQKCSSIEESSIDNNPKSKENDECNFRVAENSSNLIENHSNVIGNHSDGTKSEEKCKKKFCKTCGDSLVPGKRCRHGKMKQSGNPLEYCDIKPCTKKFYGKDLLENHKHEVHLICKKCHKVFTKRSKINYHFEKEHEKLFECEFCSKILPTMQLLTRHRFRHTGEYPFKCEYCPIGCISKSKFEDHMSTHTNEPRYVCTECGQTFISASSFGIHRKWHINPKPYKCPECLRLFSTHSHMNMHRKRIHNIGEKRYNCKFCERKFVAKFQMQTHEFSHTGGYRFICEKCGKTFKKRILYVKHKMSKHNDFSETLKKCEYKMIVKPLLQMDAVDSPTLVEK